MVDHKLKDLRGPARRDFLKWVGAAAAGVALERSRLLNYLNDSGGSALADEACSPVNRSVHIVCGNGSFAWFQLLWPHLEIAAANNPAFAYHAKSTDGFTFTGSNVGDKPFHYGPQAPWVKDQIPLRPVTAFMAGKDETHTDEPVSAASLGGNNSMLATVASIQSVAPALVPVIGMAPLKFGDAPGAPAIATVSSAASMVDLFNSVFSKLTASAQGDRALFEVYTKALLGVRHAAGSPSRRPHIETAKKAAHLVGLNFGAALTPVAQDLTNYGIANVVGVTATQKAGLENFGRAMITAARAITNGLTNSVILAVSPGPTSDRAFTDPHVTFASATTITQARNTAAAFGAILNGFYNDLAKATDPACGAPYDQSVVLTVHGDTPHSPLIANGWPDQTPQGSNWLYVMGQGHLKTGWFGGVRPNGGKGAIDGFDPATGMTVPDQASGTTTSAAGAAVAYAVARGNKNTVAAFYKGGPITGIVV